MSRWNPSQYLAFGQERTRPAVDLVARIDLDSPASIVDLGCGPGNSTQILRARWPKSSIVGVDFSPEMIDSARERYPLESWELADLSTWNPSQPIDLVFSNAALHWLSDHQLLIVRLFSIVGEGGALAFQIPSSSYPMVRTIAHEISMHPKWKERLKSARTALTMKSPAYYYDLLAPFAREIDIWETEYIHVMDSAASIIDWFSSTGLRPFLDGLESRQDREEFLTTLRQSVADTYSTQVNGKVLFPFRRTFVLAYR